MRDLAGWRRFASAMGEGTDDALPAALALVEQARSTSSHDALEVAMQRVLELVADREGPAAALRYATAALEELEERASWASWIWLLLEVGAPAHATVPLLGSAAPIDDTWRDRFERTSARMGLALRAGGLGEAAVYLSRIERYLGCPFVPTIARALNWGPSDRRISRLIYCATHRQEVMNLRTPDTHVVGSRVSIAEDSLSTAHLDALEEALFGRLMAVTVLRVAGLDAATWERDLSAALVAHDVDDESIARTLAIESADALPGTTLVRAELAVRAAWTATQPR